MNTLVDETTFAPPDPDATIVTSSPTVKLDVFKRMQRAGKWTTEVQALRDRMVQEARKTGLSKDQAQSWAYGELERMYLSEGVTEESVVVGGASIQAIDQQAATPRANGFAGDPPADWPELPASASLAAELGWVQSNRLRIITETPNGPRCDLSRALEPAPSRAAIAWLETSSRNYAKFTDVLARVAAQSTDESETTRRERQSLHEIETLLSSMTGGF